MKYRLIFEARYYHLAKECRQFIDGLGIPGTCFSNYFLRYFRRLLNISFIVCIAALSSATPFSYSMAGDFDELKQGADALLIVDCLLPGDIGKLRRGVSSSYETSRRPIKTSALDCERLGGKYVIHERSNITTALKVWLLRAQQGDPEAQTYVGEIYEKGLEEEPDFVKAAEWYQRAAEQGYAPAQINLGNLYENGLDVSRDIERACSLYEKGTGLPECLPENVTLKALKAEEPTIEIEIIEPVVPSTRGIVLISVEHDITEKVVIGRVRAPAGLLTLTVNDQDTSIEANGIFRTRLPVHGSGSEVAIVAVDTTGQRAVRRFRIKPAESGPPPADFGNYHALVIGNNDYRNFPSLQTARSDAETVGEILRTKYGFKVTPLYDANRYQILTTLNQLRETLTEEDNLLIYYAGHSELDKINDRGHWLPVDAEPDSTANWISNVALTDILNAMSARHIMVVADAAYSGTLTRSMATQLRAGQTDEARATYYRTVVKARSRTALTSGGLAPVLDAGRGGHSVFANAFIDSLRSSEEGVLEGQRLFLDVVARVTQAAYDRRFEQVPQYAPIKYTRHEAGDFFFVLAGE